MNIIKYSPIGGSSYIKLPKFVENKKAVVNIRNNDQHCFAWAVTSAMFPTSDRSSEVSSYPHYSSMLNTTGMDFPVKLKDISSFEKINNISIYGVERRFDSNKIKYEIGSLRYAEQKLRLHNNLLYMSDDKVNSHYCWIKNLSRLVSSQISAIEHKQYFCDGCLLYFSNITYLKIHQDMDCSHVFTVTSTCKLSVNRFGNQVPENQLKFEYFERQIKVPFVVYADFESILKPIDMMTKSSLFQAQQKPDPGNDINLYQTDLAQNVELATKVVNDFEHCVNNNDSDCELINEIALQRRNW